MLCRRCYEKTGYAIYDPYFREVHREEYLTIMCRDCEVEDLKEIYGDNYKQFIQTPLSNGKD